MTQIDKKYVITFPRSGSHSSQSELLNKNNLGRLINFQKRETYFENN